MRPRRRRIRRQPAAMSEDPKRRFVKIILPSAIHGKQTRIPEEFIRSFGDELSDIARIIVPDGRIWKIGLKKCGNDVWFCDNWHEFAQHYSIRYGSVLTFKYKGDSEFGVRIHDTTATEIRYPIPTNKNQRSSTSRGRGRPRAKTPSNRKGEEEAASPRFQATIGNFNVYVPAEFASNHLRVKRPLKLQNWNGETWDAACSSHNRTSAAMRIGKGWLQFARDNRLSPGDICVFKLIKQTPLVVLKVEIISRPPHT